MTILRNLKSWRHRYNIFFGTKTDLSYILSQSSPSAPLSERIEWLEQLIGWVNFSRANKQESMPESLANTNLQAIKIRFILQLVERNPEMKKRFSATLRSILIESSGVSLFSETELSQETGLVGEVFSRLTRKFLPAPPKHSDLSQVFARVFNSQEDAIWVRNLSPEVCNQIANLLRASEPEEVTKLFRSFSQDMLDALLILGARVENLGLSLEIRDRLEPKRIIHSPFLKLNQLLYGLEDLEQLPRIIKECRADIQSIYSHLENAGVSVKVVYRLDVLTSSIDRIEVLTLLLGGFGVDEHQNIIPEFIARLIEDNIGKNSVIDLLRNQLRLLAKKIVERTGESGEHYIARDRNEWRHIFVSALGGGVLTTFTTLLKFFINSLKAAPFFSGIFFWVNYSGSFLLMQAFGFSLATKQPSATAPALAGKLKQLDDSHQIDQFVDEVIRIIRSQFAAALGNVGAVIPCCILVSYIFQYFSKGTLIDQKEAHHIIASFHPFKTLTLVHATITGVILWLSSIAGGWLENWVVYHQIPEAIAQNRRFNIIFGRERCLDFSKKLLRASAGIGINITLGFLLAFFPIIARFFGSNLEAKHITLSTGALSIALSSIPHSQLENGEVAFAFLGIICIGILNFGVSFFLALVVAQRARGVEAELMLKLAFAVKRRFLKSPVAFLFAPVKQD